MISRCDEFTRKRLWLLGSSYLFHSYGENLRYRLEKDFHDPSIAVRGFVTEGGTTWLRGIQVRRDEAAYMLRDFSGFLRLTREQTITGSFRAIVDYLLDLIVDISNHGRVRVEERIAEDARERAISANRIPRVLEEIGLGLDPEHLTQYHLLRETRNVLEHNDSVINERYIECGGIGIVGRKLVIESERVRSALVLIHEIAIDIENRAYDAGLVADSPAARPKL